MPETTHFAALLDSLADAVADRVAAKLPKPAAAHPARLEPPVVTRLLLDQPQACIALGNISVRTMHDWRTRLGLPFLRIGGKLFFVPDDLARWRDQLKAQQQKTTLRVTA